MIEEQTNIPRENLRLNNPRIVLALITLALSLQYLIPWLADVSRPVPILSVLLLPVAWFLYRGKRFSFRIFRFLTWALFILSFFFGLTILFSSSYDGLYIAHSRILSVFWYFGWDIAWGALLYYTDLERVKTAFHTRRTAEQSDFRK